MLKIKPSGIATKFMKTSFKIIPKAVESLLLIVSIITLQNFSLCALANKFLIRFEHGWQMTLVPLCVCLVSQSLVVVRIPPANTIHSGEFIIWEFIFQNPCSWQLIGVTIEPCKPESFFVVVFVSLVEIVSAPHCWVTVAEFQRP